jgi:methionyl-tRNA formyltransferase
MIVIAGKNNIAVYALEVIFRQFGQDSVVVIPNKNDDGKDGWQRSLRKKAKELGVQVFSLSEVEKIKSVSLFLSLEYDSIIEPQNFSTDRIFNIHFSDLPDYKGMYTSFWPIINGDSSAAVTLHKIDRGIDTGDVVGKRKFAISSHDRSIDLYQKYIKNSMILFDGFLGALISGDFLTSPQGSTMSRYYSKKSIDYSTVEIDLKVTAWQLKRQVYAYSFRPYQLPIIEGKPAVEVEITSQRSLLRPGYVVNQGQNHVCMSTIDYDVNIYFDMLESFLAEVAEMELDAFNNKLKNIAGVNDRNANGWSPIIVAAYHGRVDLISELLSRGANVNDQNVKGTSVLMYAKDFCLQHKNRSLFDFLVDNGADINILDYKGKALVDYLSPVERGFFKIKI